MGTINAWCSFARGRIIHKEARMAMKVLSSLSELDHTTRATLALHFGWLICSVERKWGEIFQMIS